MEVPAVLTVHAAQHPSPRVREVGFDIEHPYVEQCWTSVVGPTSVLMLRRFSLLWREHEPAEIPAEDLARSLGLEGGTSSRHHKLWRTAVRLVQFGLGRAGEGGGLDVFVQVKPLQPRQLDRLPAWTVEAHHRLLGDHVRELAAGSTTPATPTAAVDAHLDHLQLPAPPAPDGLGR